MSDRSYELSRRKVLGGLGAVGAASAGTGLGTSALLWDEETFGSIEDPNVLEAGTLDLFVHYDYSADQGAVGGNLATPHSGVVQNDVDTNTGARATYELTDVKPGDSGELEFCFAVVDNPAFLSMTGRIVGDADNGVTEPEGDSPWERDGDASGELARYTRAGLYYSTADGDADDVLITAGTLAGIMADLTHGMPLHGDGDPSSGVVDRPTFGPASDGDDIDDVCLKLAWHLPRWVRNEVQSDSVEFTLAFHATQARHNDGTGGMTVVEPGDDLQTAIDDASGGDTLLLVAGTHTGAVTVDKPLEIRGEGPSNTTYDGGGAATGMSVESSDVRVGNLTATNAGQAIDVNGQATGSGRAADVMLSGIVATGNSDRALVVDYTDRAIVRDVETTGNGNDGLTLWYTNDSHVETVVANDNGDNGIYVNGDDVVLLDVEAKRNVDEGIDLNWYDDLGPATQRVTVDNAVAMDNGEDDVELHDNGTDDAVADSSMLLRQVETGGAPTGLRLVQVDESEVTVVDSSFPNGTLDGSDNDVDP